MQKDPYIDFTIIAKSLGAFIMVVGVLMFVPAMVALYYQGSDVVPLFGSALLSVFVGVCLHRGVGRHNPGQMPRMNKREGYIIVTFSWVAMSLFGAIPFIIDHNINTYSDAFLETISGFTTTGLSVLDNVEALPKGLLFWRSMTQWIGGIGIIMLGLTFLPLMGISGGNDLFAAEVTGPAKDKLRPRISETAKNIMIIYVCLTLLETVFLMFGEMDFFDAICHSFSTIATGGFSTQNTSLQMYGTYTQYVVLVFMLLSGINFGLFFFMVTGKFERIRKNSELKAYICFILLSVAVIAVILTTSFSMTFEETFRDSAFMATSFITTTGFINNPNIWLPATNVFLFLLLFSGACAGSTSGGIKMARYTLLLKNMSAVFKHLLHPRAIIPIKYNGQVISPELIFKILAFFFMYIILVMVGAFAFSALGYEMNYAFGISALALGNVGTTVGESINFLSMPLFGKWLLCLYMVIGRLELFTVLILFTPSFWKK